jgi:hypothetical protein
MNTFEAMERVRRCESICLAGKAAAEFYYAACLADRSLLPADDRVRIRDIRQCRQDLEDTFLVRMFAVFESVLRAYWRSGLRRRTHPNMQTLLDRVASSRHVPSDRLSTAHSVRDYRNAVVHTGTAPAVSLADARAYLCTFLSHLPKEW